MLLPSMASSPMASTFFLMLLQLVMMVAIVGASGPNDPTPSCIGNELQSVIGTCGGTFSSGGGARNPQNQPPPPPLSPNSGCCIALRSVSLPCLCSQLASSGLASAITPATASTIRTACHLRIPPGTRCAGNVYYYYTLHLKAINTFQLHHALF